MQVGVAVEEVADDLDAFFWLERAGAVDEDAAWFGQFDRLRNEPPLQSRERGDVVLALEPGDIGVAADGARRSAGRIQQDGVKRLGLPLRDVGGYGFRGQMQAGQVLSQPFEAGGRAREGVVPRDG